MYNSSARAGKGIFQKAKPHVYPFIPMWFLYKSKKNILQSTVDLRNDVVAGPVGPIATRLAHNTRQVHGSDL